ncbi:hypothetical protein [Actinoplanes xinjiangensis]|uniref:hypothetical protein n=1 Tax=Actinoplanes xinjiangensis TaxID=512350 RepID=UPI00344901F8
MNTDDELPTAPSFGPLQVVANKCTAGHCPTVYSTSYGTVVVQGYTVQPASAGVTVPDGECLVEVPVDLLTEATRNLS